MKNIFIQVIKWTLGILGVSLGCYALSSCDKERNEEDIRVEYGCPYAMFEVKGKVVDSKTKEGLKGLSVTMNLAEYNQLNGGETASKYYVDSTVVDDNGDFELGYQMMPGDNIYVRVRDLDPATDGNYPEKTIKVDFQQSEEGSGWYEGKFSSELTIELEEIDSVE